MKHIGPIVIPLKDGFSKVLHPYFCQKLMEKCLIKPTSCKIMRVQDIKKYCVPILDCWKIHKVKACTEWMKKCYPFLLMLFVPARCTLQLSNSKWLMQRWWNRMETAPIGTRVRSRKEREREREQKSCLQREKGKGQGSSLYREPSRDDSCGRSRQICSTRTMRRLHRYKNVTTPQIMLQKNIFPTATGYYNGDHFVRWRVKYALRDKLQLSSEFRRKQSIFPFKIVPIHWWLLKTAMGGHGGLNILPQKKWNGTSR